jgi:hypothetical protein
VPPGGRAPRSALTPNRGRTDAPGGRGVPPSQRGAPIEAVWCCRVRPSLPSPPSHRAVSPFSPMRPAGSQPVLATPDFQGSGVLRVRRWCERRPGTREGRRPDVADDLVCRPSAAATARMHPYGWYLPAGRRRKVEAPVAAHPPTECLLRTASEPGGKGPAAATAARPSPTERLVSRSLRPSGSIVGVEGRRLCGAGRR